MTVEQLARLLCVPIAACLLLLAAKASGGSQAREVPFAQAAVQ